MGRAVVGKRKVFTAASLVLLCIVGLAGPNSTGIARESRGFAFDFSWPIAQTSVQLYEKPGYTIHSPYRLRTFEVGATNGYRLSINIVGRNQAILEVWSRLARVEYVADANVHHNVVRARFGDFGEMTMRFVPEGPPKATQEPQGDCSGRRATVQKGLFVGKLRWHGEDGFSAAKVNRTKGLSLRSFREVCKGVNAAVGKDEAITPSLVVQATAHGKSIELRAYFSGATPNLMALIAEPGKGLDIYRLLSEEGNVGEVRLGVGTQFRVTPGRPFAGFADFLSENASRGTWTGTLTGEFPGVGTVPLAGLSFVATRF